MIITYLEKSERRIVVVAYSGVVFVLIGKTFCGLCSSFTSSGDDVRMLERMNVAIIVLFTSSFNVSDFYISMS